MIPFISCALLDSILAKNFLYQSVDTAIRMTIARNIITNDGIEKIVDKKADKYSDTILTCNAECERSGAHWSCMVPPGGGGYSLIRAI